MIVEFQKNIQEYPKAGDVINLSGHPHILVLVATVLDKFVLIDLSDGYQMFDMRSSIEDLMDHTDNSWIILKNVKVTV